MLETKKKLALIGGRVSKRNDQLFAHSSFGKIVEAFAKRYHQIYLCSPVNTAVNTSDSSVEDYLLPENIILIPQPNWRNTVQSNLHLTEIKKSYEKAIAPADHIFVRGNPVAATSALYRYCSQYNKPVCHWLVGNPALIMPYRNIFINIIGRLYIWQWEKKLLRGRSLANGIFLCNGQELSDRYPTPKTHSVVSTTLTQDDLFKREDTCDNNTITILCLCFIRPEKGIEYLIEAIAKLQTHKSIKLIIGGSRERYPNYQEKLDHLVNNLDLEDTVEWLGNVQYHDVPKLMRKSDLFVLPTLAEGTPRVLVEARANCLPLVTTNVSGIPESVTNGHDGILVPPQNSQKLADAISQIISDESLRKQLISNGYKTVQKNTVDFFVGRAIDYLNSENNDVSNEHYESA